MERRELEKKLRVVHNKTNQAANAERAAREEERRGGLSSSSSLFTATAASGAPAKGAKRPRAAEGGGSSSGGVRLPVGIPSIPIAEGRADALAGPGKHPRPRPTDTKAVKAAQIGLAQVSTASMGKFDRKSNGEPVLKVDKLKRKRLPNEDRATEKSRDAHILASVLKGGGGGGGGGGVVTRLPPSSTTYTKPGKPGRRTQASKDQPRARAMQKHRDEKSKGKGKAKR